MNLQKGGFSYFILNHFSNAIEFSYFKQKKNQLSEKFWGQRTERAT